MNLLWNQVEINLDGEGKSEINTGTHGDASRGVWLMFLVCAGIGFLDHMLTALSKHSRMDIKLTCKVKTLHQLTSALSDVLAHTG